MKPLRKPAETSDSTLTDQGQHPQAGMTMPAYYPNYPEDEISLVDLAVVLIQRKWLMVGVFSACVLIGLLYAYIRPQQHTYTTILELGVVSTITDGVLTISKIEPPKSVLAKLIEQYIPVGTRAFLEADKSRAAVAVEARIPKGSDIVILTSKGNDLALHQSLHQAITQQIIQSHQQSIDTLRQLYASALAADRAVFAAITSKNSVNQASPAARLSVQGQEQGLKIQLAAQGLETALLSLQRRIQEQEIQVSNLQPTRASAMMVGEATGPGRKMIIALAAVLGLMLAVFAVFMVEFVAKVRERLASAVAK